MAITIFNLAVADRLERTITRGAVFADEREDVGVALTALSVELDELVRYPDHPLVDLYQALHMCSHGDDLIYLSGDHRALLRSAARFLRTGGVACE